MKTVHRKLSLVLAILLLAALLLSACSPAAPQNEPAAESKSKISKIALILPGRADDLAWNTAAYKGLESVKTELGVETTYVENVSDADVERVLRDFASQGYNLIIAHSYDYGDAALRVAKDFPEVYFLHGTATGNDANIANYDIPSHEGGYLLGLLVGHLTEKNKIGIVNSFDIPAMVMVSEAFKLGVKEVNPDAVVTETFVGAWNDAPGGKEAAEAQLDAGCDFILAMGNHTGMGAIQAAAARGVLTAGLYADQNSLAPDYVVSSIVNRFDAIIKAAIKDIDAGSFANKSYLLTMPDGAVELAPFHNLEDKVPQDVKDLLKETQEKIISGELKVPVIEQTTSQ